MILYRYILRTHVVPFLFALAVLIFIFLLQFVMKFIDQLVGKGLSIWVIFEVIVLNLAWMLVLAVPMSVLIATLMAFGGLSAKHEITAMKAAGVSLFQMMAPVLIAAIVLTVLLFFFDNDVLPEANHKAKSLMIDIRRKKPTLTLVPGLFSREISGYSIVVRKTFEPTNDLEGITIYDYTNPNASVLVTAQRGSLSFSSDYRNLIMDLQNGEIHELSTNEFREYQRIRFQKHRLAMKAEGFEFERSPDNAFARGDRELNIQAMMAIVNDLKSVNAEAEKRIKELSTQLTSGAKHGSHHPESGTNPFARDGFHPSVSVQDSLSHIRAIEAMIESERNLIDYNEIRIDQYMVEVHKKYAIPAACIIFVLVGAPLGMMARRGTFGVAASLSLGFFLFYWACLIGGEKLADRGLATPFLGMWAANIILAILGIYLTIQSGRETSFFNWTILRRLVPRRWLPPDMEADGNHPMDPSDASQRNP